MPALTSQENVPRPDAILRQTIEAHGGRVFKTVGDARFDAFWAAGQAMSLDQAVAHALSDADSRAAEQSG